MDTRSVAKAAGVRAGTLGQWIARGLIPGVSVVRSGRPRDFHLQTATLVAVFAEMVGFGLSPDDASFILEFVGATDLNEGGEANLVVIPPPHRKVILPPGPAQPPGARMLTCTEDPPGWPLPPDTSPDEERRLWLEAQKLPKRVIARLLFNPADLSRVFEDAVLPPDSFLVINFAAVARRMREAEQEWLASRGAKS